MPFLNSFSVCIFIIIALTAACKDKITDPYDSRSPSIYNINPVWSEANDLIAYIHLGVPERGDTDTMGVYVIKPDGTGKKMIYKNEAQYIFNGLDWSEDGQWLVTSVGYQIVKIKYPEGNADTLAAEGGFGFPVWSPDGTRIASHRWTGGTTGVCFIDSSGNNTRLILRRSRTVDWPFPDSLLYENFDSLFPDGSLCITDTLYSHPIMIKDLGAQGLIEPFPRMHTGTGRIVFDASENGRWASLWKYDPDADAIFKIRPNAQFPSFSPDGSLIIFINTTHGNGNVAVISWDGSGYREITDYDFLGLERR